MDANKLVKLLHAGDYARSFRDAFAVDGAVEDALALDAAANMAAEAALTDDERATPARRRRRLAFVLGGVMLVGFVEIRPKLFSFDPRKKGC